MSDARESKLKAFINQVKCEMMETLFTNKDTLDPITKAELNGRLSMLKEIEHVCEQRGRY